MIKFSLLMSMLSVFSIFNIYAVNNSLGLVSHYRTKLKREWQVIEKEMLDVLGISKEHWVRFQENNYHKYLEYENQLKRKRKKNSLPLNSNEKSFCLSICKKAGISNNKVEFIKPKSFSRLLTSDSAIYLPEDGSYFNGTKRKEIEASIMHELMHILNKDDSFRFIFEVFVDKNDCLAVENIFKKIMHFQEKRADILAGLFSPTYARALYSFYKSALKKYRDVDTDTHPRLSSRVFYMRELYKKLS